MSAAHIPDDDDRGAEGPAALARTVTVVEIEGRSTGSASPGERVIVRRLHVECKLDELLMRGSDIAWLGIDHRQWAAGMRFRRLWLTANRGPRMVASYAPKAPANADRLVPGEANAGARAELGAALKALTAEQWAAVVRVAGCDRAVGQGWLAHAQGCARPPGRHVGPGSPPRALIPGLDKQNRSRVRRLRDAQATRQARRTPWVLINGSWC